MKRILSLWFPRWAIQRVVVDRPELHSSAIVLHARDARRGQCVVTCCETAAALGVRNGMPVAEVNSLTRRRPTHSRLTMTDGNNVPDGSGRSRSSSATRQTPLRPAALHYEPYDANKDRQRLEELAGWCERFSPVVGLEQEDPPQGLLLDVTGLAPLFGSELRLAEALLAACQTQGYQARLAIAHSVGAAWAVARFGSAAMFSPSQTNADSADTGLEDDNPDPDNTVAALTTPVRAEPILLVPQAQVEAESYLAQLPVAALRLPDTTLELLQQLGLPHVGDLLVLPRSSLAARLGPLLHQRLDQLLGRCAEVIQAHRPTVTWESRWIFEHPTTRRDELEFVLQHLTSHLCEQLVAHDHGAMELEAIVQMPPLPSQTLRVGLFEPTADVQRVTNLFHMQLESLQLRAAVQTVTMRVTAAVRAAQQQYRLWQDAFQVPNRDLTDLVERLSGRLGLQQVVSIQAAASVLPERAYREKPLAGATRRTATSSTASTRRVTSRASAPTSRIRRQSDVVRETSASESEPSSPCGWQRPLRLNHPPQPLSSTVTSRTSSQPQSTQQPPIEFRWQGEQYQTARHWGPERIETAWWRGRCLRRDYYRIETTQGYRFWIFRNLADGRWFLHGCFD